MTDRRRPPDPLEERISQLGEPTKQAVPPTYPVRLGFGKVMVPPKPERLPLASSPEHELTKEGVAPPSPGSAPMPSVEATNKRFPPRPQESRGRSFSPPPGASEAEEQAIDREARSEGARVVRSRSDPRGRPYSPPQSVRAEDFRADAKGIHVTWGTVRKVAWWAMPVVLSVLGTVTGYFEGLKRAGERMAANEERDRLNAEADKRRDVRIQQLEEDRDWSTKVIRDHDSRLPKLKTELEEVREAQPRIQGLKK